MPSPRSNDATALLSTAQSDAEAARLLVDVLYDELRVIAGRLLEREAPGHTLQPTALVNELYLKLIDQTRIEADGRAHFLGIASRAMRQILVDHARAKKADKRGGDHVRRDLGSHIAEPAGRRHDILALDEAIRRLGELKPRVAQVVEMRFFGGMLVEEVGTALGVSHRTVEVDWRFARAWLSREISRSEPDAR